MTKIKLTMETEDKGIQRVRQDEVTIVSFAI